jgi:hypothetical protein
MNYRSGSPGKRKFPLIRQVLKLLHDLLRLEHSSSFFWIGVSCATAIGFLWSAFDHTKTPLDEYLLLMLFSYTIIAIVASTIVFWWPNSRTGKLICKSRLRMLIAYSSGDSGFDRWDATRFRNELNLPEIQLNRRNKTEVILTMTVYPVLLPFFLHLLAFEKAFLRFSRWLKRS